MARNIPVQSSIFGVRKQKILSDNSRQGIIDCFHGESPFAPVPKVIELLHRATLLNSEIVLPYQKSQPGDIGLRKLFAEKVFYRFAEPVSPENIIVSPYSSTILLDAVVRSLCVDGENNIFLAPAGFYKSNTNHVIPWNASLHVMPLDKDYKLSAQTLAETLKDTPNVRGVMLTYPGNPFLIQYNEDELKEFAVILEEFNCRVICDSLFQEMIDDHFPIANFYYDKTLTIGGISKSHNASGPYKMGAACSGDKEWLKRVSEQMPQTLQKETTLAAWLFLAHTPPTYFSENREIMAQQQKKFADGIDTLNNKQKIFEIVAPSKTGMFANVALTSEGMERMGITFGWELAELLLMNGITSVPGDQTGFDSKPMVRLNILAPIINQRKSPENIEYLLKRLEECQNNTLSYSQCLAGYELMPDVYSALHR
ncbi:MAG: pyridoxal phosphate-dependent aminotransferase [Holosporales bacterium]